MVTCDSLNYVMLIKTRAVIANLSQKSIWTIFWPYILNVMIVLYHCLSSTEKSKKITWRIHDELNLLQLLYHIFNISIFMKNIFSSSKQNISSLLLWDTPPNEITSITDVRRSNRYEYKRILKLYWKTLKGASFLSFLLQTKGGLLEKSLK